MSSIIGGWFIVAATDDLPSAAAVASVGVDASSTGVSPEATVVVSVNDSPVAVEIAASSAGASTEAAVIASVAVVEISGDDSVAAGVSAWVVSIAGVSPPDMGSASSIPQYSMESFG